MNDIKTAVAEIQNSFENEKYPPNSWISMIKWNYWQEAMEPKHSWCN